MTYGLGTVIRSTVLLALLVADGCTVADSNDSLLPDSQPAHRSEFGVSLEHLGVSPSVESWVRFAYCSSRHWRIYDEHKLWETRDDGASWSLLFELPTSLSVGIRCIEFADPENGWMIRGSSELHRTRDGGRSWRSCSVVYGSTSQGFRGVLNGVLSWNGGRHIVLWGGSYQRTSDLVGPSFLVDEATNSALRPCVLTSRDDGATWRLEILSPQMGRVEGLLQLRSDVFLADGYRVFVSRDSGDSWVSLRLPGTCGSAISNGEPELELRGTSVTPSGTVVASNWDGTIFKSRDNGQTWDCLMSSCLDCRSVSVFSGVILFFGESAALGVTLVDQLVATEDGGATWRPVALDSEVRAWKVVKNGLIVVLSDNSVYRVENQVEGNTLQ